MINTLTECKLYVAERPTERALTVKIILVDDFNVS